MGTPTPRERHGERATVGVGGVTTSKASAGKRRTGQRVAGGTFLNRMELAGREMRKSFLILAAKRGFLWKAECIERCPLGLGKGSWKRVND